MSGNNSRPPPPPMTTSVQGPASSLAVQSEQPDSLLLSNLSVAAERGSSPAADSYDNISLTDVTVPLESIKPSEHRQ